MNESKKMKKSITLPFDENSRRLIIILVVLLFITGITKSSQFLNVGNVQSIGKQLTEYGLMSLGMGICMWVHLLFHQDLMVLLLVFINALMKTFN